MSHSQRPARQLLVALVALLSLVQCMALLKGSLFSRSMDRTVEDLTALRLANNADGLGSRLTTETLAEILSTDPGRFLESRANLSKGLIALRNARAHLIKEPNWQSSDISGRDFNAYAAVVQSICSAPSQAQAKTFVPQLLKDDSVVDAEMRKDISGFSISMTGRSADRLWLFGGLFPGVCAFIVVALTAILLPPSLRRIRKANEMLVTLEAASANQAAELEERNSELQAQQEILREHEADLIMKTQELESTSYGSQQAARRFEELFQGLPVACVGFSHDGRIFEWNRASTELFGHDAYQVLHQDLWRNVAESGFRRKGASILRQVFLGKAFKNTEWSYVRSDGERRHVLGHLFPVRGLDGRILGGIATCLDVTDRKRAEDELRSSEKLFKDLIDSLHEGVLLYDHAGRIVVANRQASVFLGSQQGSLLGRRVEQLKKEFIDADAKPLSNEKLPFSRCLSTGEPVEEALVGWVEYQGNKREVRWFSINAIPLHRMNEAKPYGVLSSFSEVTERLEHEAQLKDRQGLLEQANTQLEALAVTDGLTGLYNHRAFQERLESEISSNRGELSLILVDVDLFKSYNDTYGHPEGDRVLRQVAALLRDTVGEDGIAARYGGEEFAIILPGHDANSATKFGEKLCQAIAEMPWLNRSITISAGVATLNDTYLEPANLIRASDEALYASKHAGRNRSIHADTLFNAKQRAA